MTIQLNLTPKQAHWLYNQTSGFGCPERGAVHEKLFKQVSKFAAAVPTTELKFPGTGNINLATPLADQLEEVRTKAIGDSNECTKKIAIIKAIRELCGGEALGLADAKGATENWPAFIAFVRANNRLPLPGFYNYYADHNNLLVMT